MKPHIICHMVSSVDGKIDGAALSAVMRKGEYGATGAKLNRDAWIRYEVVRSKTARRERKNNAKA